MSDAVRSYTPRTHLPLQPRHRKTRKKGRGCGAALFLAVLVVVGGVFWWLTRDTYPLERLIPADQKYQLFAADVLTKRGKVAESEAWRAIPPSLEWSNIPQKLAEDFGMPQWILNNLLPGTCHVSGNALEAFSDVLFVTKTTRIGCLLGKLSRFLPMSEHDVAGGLHLRRLAGQDLYYAVRGRLLLVSPSRDALIRALTVRQEDSLGEKRPAAWGVSGAEDVQGTVTLSPEDPLGNVFRNLTFAVRVDSHSVTAKCRGVLRPEFVSRFGDLLAEAQPQTLLAPPEGILQVSLNLGKPVRELWTATGEALDKRELLEGLWESWSAAPDDGVQGAPRLATGLLGPLGPGIRLSWRGVDLNAMLPMPEVVATLDSPPDRILEAFEAIPPPPPGSRPWDMYPRYDPETKRVHLPLIGGPSIEPTAGVYGDALLISSSRTVGDALLDAPPKAAPLDQKGNLYVRVRPAPCIKAVSDVASLFVAHNLLRGWTSDKLAEAVAPWSAAAAVIDEITALGAYDNGEVSADLELLCAKTAEE